MIVTKLVVEDFLPFKGVQELDLSPTAGRPVVVVFADNMRGKTSILNAIRWVLYGSAYKHTGRKIPAHQILNRETREAGKYDFGATLEFNVGSDQYRLTRRAMPRKLVDRPDRDADYEVHESMLKNGSLLPHDQIIHEINQVAPEQISRFFLFDGELLDQYEALLVEGSDQGRMIRDAIERVLGVPALVRARDDLRLLERAAIRVHDRDAKQVEGVAEQEARVVELLDAADQLDESRQTYEAQIQDMQHEIDDLEAALEGAERALGDQARLEGVIKNIEEDEASIKRTEEALRASRAELWEDVLAGAVQPIAESLSGEASNLLSAVSQRQSLTRQIAHLKQHLSQGVCATCKQPLSGTARAEIDGELEGSYRRLAELTVNPNRLQQVVSQQQMIGKIRRNGSLNTVKSLEGVVNTTTLRMIERENEREQLEAELEGQDTESMKVKRSRLRAVESEVATLRQALAEAEDGSAAKQRQAMVLRRAIELNSTSTRQARSKLRRDTYSGLRAIVDRTIDGLRDRLRREVETHATSAFKRMTTQAEYAELRINESYGLSIVDRRGRDVPLRSAGAEQVVALALINGLHQTGMGAGGVIMDTPFGRLDPQHRKNIMMHLVTSSPQVVMLVHEGEMARGFVIEHIAGSVARVYDLASEGVFATRIRAASLGVEL